MTKRARGGIRIIDIRKRQLVRLDPNHSRAVWKQLREASQKVQT